MTNGGLVASNYLGIAISEDNGKTWKNKSAADGFGGSIVYSFLVEGDAIYVPSDNKLLISTDAGNTWATHKVPNSSQLISFAKINHLDNRCETWRAEREVE